MAEILTAAEMRAAEKAVMTSGAATGLELMERAGAGVVDALLETWPAYRDTQPSVAVLCGPGNNGGDGFVVARLLKARGWAVQVFLLGAEERLPADAATNCTRWQALGPLHELTADTETAALGGPAVIVDALFGTGLRRPVDLPLARLAQASDGGPAPRIVAIDLPSGLCSDSGRVLGGPEAQAMAAALTVTFHRARQGHMLAQGPALCGQLVIKQIGLPQDAAETARAPDAPPISELIDSSDLALSTLQKGAGHKYAHGHALVLSGGAGRTGAARLAARGALRIGAGLVTLGVPPAAQMEVAQQVTAVMLRRITDAEALAETVADPRITALCLGPALGLGAAQAALVGCVLKSARPAVLDADALTLIAQDRALFAALHSGCVLTPHGGEFERLFPDIAAQLAAPAVQGPAYSKVDAARDAARRAGCVVLFKGADTVVAGPDGACRVCAPQPEAAWLATAGSGDVLAGFIAGLLARGLPPMEAAASGAVLHRHCARLFGPGLIAEDLPDILPAVFRELGV